MKKLFLLLLFPLCVNAQDTTKVLGFAMQAQLIEFLAPTIASPDNDAAFNVFLKWRTALRSSKVTGTVTVTTDTIPTDLLAVMYDNVMNAPNGYIIGTIMKTALTTPRKNNKYLDKLCAAVDDKLAAALLSKRNRGRLLLLGK